MTTARIIVVEDERIIALRMKQQLSKLGYEIAAVVSSGEAALLKIVELRPDVVFMDIHIEGQIDGIETATRIPAEFAVAVIYMTAYCNEATLERARSTKPYGYLVKPFSEQEMHATAQMAIERLHGDLALRKSQHNLRLSEERANRANEAKSRFLAGMSHELRTPLNGILGYAQLLRLEGGLNTAQLARVDAMMDTGRHLLQMINAVLDLSEIEAGRVELRSSEFDLHGVCRECLAVVRPLAQAKGLRLGIVIEPHISRLVIGDSLRLRQILLNLLGNAVKFTTRGSVKLRIGLATEGAGVRLEVADTGPGISAEQRQRLFREFGRPDLDVSGGVEGVGLGLAISAQLATLMGGSLRHNDNPAGGSLFSLEVPLVTKAPQSELDAMPTPDCVHRINTVPRDATGQMMAGSRSLRVLVVDDDSMNRDIAGSFLRAAGHEVICVESGTEAVEAAAGSEYDAVLMDVRMPGIDGLEATRRIRTLTGARGKVPIIALTAQVFAQQIEECSRAGMDRCLAKPFDQDTLLNAVAVAANARNPNSIVVTTPCAIGVRRTKKNNVPSTQQPTSRESCEDPTGSGETVPAVDRRPLIELLDFLGHEHLASLLLTFRQQVGRSPLEKPRDDVDKATLERQMHLLSSTAGTLGFVALSTCCRRLERALGSGTAIEIAFEEAVSAFERAGPALDSLIAEMANRPNVPHLY